MIEVEAKIAISNPKKYRQEAKKLGKFICRKKKVDDYYTLQSLKSYPKKSLRVRKMGSFYVINFKKGLSYKDGIHAKKETEFRVSDLKGFLSLIEDFGFRKWLTKVKESESYEIKKNFHIEINNVSKLGWFLEIEYLVSNEKEISRARREILKVIDRLGAGRKNIIRDGYTKMFWDKGFVKKA